tara:strand:+ start:22392 stop:23027 length:636 start_codon:yes stop_codon:yes gene_type:complete
MNLSILIIAILSYLIGSISGGVIVGRIKNVDIRTKGSKAAGATNAFRTMGALFALSVLLIDVYKGYFSTLYLPYFFGEENIMAKSIAGFFSIIGHVFPIFFKFKGGKGVGTALGTLLAFPQLHLATLIGFLSWLSSLLITGYVGLGSIIAGIVVLLFHLLTSNFIFDILTIYILFISIFFVITHRENIKRLINGTENQFQKIMLFNFFKKR